MEPGAFFAVFLYCMDGRIPVQPIDLTEHVARMATNKNRSKYTIDIYTRALKACKLSYIDPSDLPAIWTYLTQRLNSGAPPVFVRSAFSICRTSLKRHGVVWAHDQSYNLLVSKLNKKHGKPREAYTDEEIKEILNAVQLESDGMIFRACLLMCLSGLSIGACQLVTFDRMKQISGDVWVFPATSKGRTYVAAISNYGHDLLVSWNWRKSNHVVPYSEYSYKTPFPHLFRNKLRYILLQKGFRDTLKGKSIQNSMRRWAIHKWATTLHSDDVALLAGNASAYRTEMKFDIDSAGRKIPVEWEEKVAQAYQSSVLNSWRLH